VCVTMYAFEIAPLSHVPDYNGLLVFGKLEQVRRQLSGFAAITKSIGCFDGAAIQFRNTYHLNIPLG